MHFFYIDEAGHTGKDLQNPEQPIFVMAAIAVSDEKWNRTDTEVAQIILDYFNEDVPQNFELHAEQLLSPNGDGPFENHTRIRRNQLANDILTKLDSRGHPIFICSIAKEHLDTIDIPDRNLSFDWKDPWEISFDLLLTLF